MRRLAASPSRRLARLFRVASGLASIMFASGSMPPALAIGNGQADLARNLEPVVVPGQRFRFFEGTPVDRFGLFRRTATGGWEDIPFQIDERIVGYDLTAAIPTGGGTGCPTVPPGAPHNCTDLYVLQGCQYGCPAQPSGQVGLSAGDELVFMARDVGSEMPQGAALPAGADTSFFEIVVTDTIPATPRRGWVYLFKFATSLVPSAQDYVSFASGSGSCGVNPLAACSTITTSGVSPAFQIKYANNWALSSLCTTAGGACSGTLSNDLLDRVKWYGNPVDGGVSEDVFSSVLCPQFMGYIDGRARVVRVVQGARSGIHTIMLTYVYPTLVDQIVELRVHPDIREIGTFVDYHRQATSEVPPNPEMKLWVKAGFVSGAASDDDIDGDGTASPPFPATGTNYLDWSAVESTLGSLVHLVREGPEVPVADPSVDKKFRYVDDRNASQLSGDDAGEWGSAKSIYSNVGNTQDLSCAAGEKQFALLTRRMHVLSNINSSELLKYEEQLKKPLVTTVSGPVPLPNPVTPCTPTLHVALTTDSYASTDEAITPCNPALGYRIYRKEQGASSFDLIADLGSATTFRDRTVTRGTTFVYVARAYNGAGVESASSTPVTIAISDTTAPAAPSGISVTAGSRSAAVNWSYNLERDAYGYDVYASQTVGGPYQKLNTFPIKATSFVASGLQPEVTYYLVLKALDTTGNASGFSAEFSVTTLP